jgi:toxin ParE1/3/4
MTNRVGRTSDANQDLLNIWLYIAEDSVRAADRVLASIRDYCIKLADAPGLGRPRNELAQASAVLP